MQEEVTAPDSSRPTRLFVPLASEPYKWFSSGEKQWEVRVHKNRFTTRHVYPGRRVELRRGYSDATRSIWGHVTEVILAKTMRQIFDRIDYHRIIPTALTNDEAVGIASSILRISPDELCEIVAFRVDKDTAPPELRVDSRYIDKILFGTKTTTIRRGLRRISLGPAILRSGDRFVPVIVNDVRYTTYADLSESDAIEDGFGELPELQRALNEHYPEIAPKDLLSVITFKIGKLDGIR